ncbi:hypothetical protein QTP86_020639 [Hemibagrus guttatus]|nr:hypothetical protein QTP86_020639 [Hemibagrus guttatus]
MASVVEESASLASGHVPHVYEDFREVFSEDRATRLPSHRAWDCAIDLLPNTSPPRAFHIPSRGRVFLCGKEGWGLRPCIDYRGLNAITDRYPYPLPLVPAALEQLRGAKFFTKLDLRSAYNLVRIYEGDEWKTHTTHGHYEYLVMPFGLTNAPAVFQSLINKVFQDILGKWVIAYIDDILVYSTSLEEHVCHVREVLSRLQRHHLFVKPKKCEFHKTMMTFQGYVITRQGVEMDVTKVQAVTEWPSPTTVKELQWFLGFANFYRRFIRNYSSMAGPLTSLLKGKPRRLAWTDQAQAAFQQLKDCFTTVPILRHPDLPFVVEVDASSSGIEAMLSQRHSVQGKLHPCAFYSRKLTAAEANYDVGNRELLSIKAALEEWQHWLEGACYPFLVLTDHHNLEYLRGAKRLNPRQARWALFFTCFQFSESREQQCWSEFLPLELRRQRIQANRRRRPHPPYQVGQRVWLSTRKLRLKLPCRKLSPKFVGPFEIIRQVNPVSYRLWLPASYHICPTFHVSLLKPAHPPGIGETDCVEPPPPLDVEGSPAYQVHALLDSRQVRSRIQYLVDWEGYGPKERSWVDAADILDPSLSEDFHRDHLNKPAPRTRGQPWRRTPGGVPRGGGSVTPRPRSGHEREPSPDF